VGQTYFVSAKLIDVRDGTISTAGEFNKIFSNDPDYDYWNMGISGAVEYGF
jgi:hypothetical protein